MNKYELTLIVNAKIEDDARAATVEKAKEYITRFGGTVTEVEDWGKKRLAYEIQKMREGFYYFIQFESEADAPRNPEIVRRYLDAGVHRVIIGTAAVTAPSFLQEMVDRYGEKIAVGVDVRDGMAAIRGWQEKSALTCDALFQRLTEAGVQTVICTDISKDGMLAGPNMEMYKSLSEKYSVRLIASGGVTTLEDVKKLRDMHLYGAILGKAIYTGAIDLAAAVLACQGVL